ncbi:hypothetical protein AADEFJLK_00326 [Methylovulum psychrotolerans]|uniref:Uncharacterized protein n=1 Tax=Methylovulum psychrotolerans TaxID=1704499 RepID=A0A2S5CRD4_9GAMM|nr:hypothetical protein AADEFJLK_00326 [Methylovulum psychrotolerans]
MNKALYYYPVELDPSIVAKPACTVCGGSPAAPLRLVLACTHCLGTGFEPKPETSNSRKPFVKRWLSPQPCPFCQKPISYHRTYAANAAYKRITRAVCGCGLDVDERHMINPCQDHSQRTRDFSAYILHLFEADRLPDFFFYLLPTDN